MRRRAERRTAGGALPAPAVLAASFAAGSVPFANLAARAVAGTDLRHVGNGTVSGTGLYRVAGFGPLAAAGVLDVAKGAVGPLLAGRRRLLVGTAAAALAVTGHNWSPLLGGAGGRGLSPALGATAVLAPEGTVILLGAVVAGRLARSTGLATLAGLGGLGPLLWWRRRWPGLAVALAVAIPMVAKRLAGNGPATGDRRAVLASRLLFDRDPDAPSERPEPAGPVGGAYPTDVSG